MLCYIKDGKTFETKCAAHAEYDISVKSVYDESSSITLCGLPNSGVGGRGARRAAAGDLVFLDGFCGVVREAESRSGTQILTCDDALCLLERRLFVSSDSGVEGVELFIKRQIEENFTQISDPEYRLGYLRVETLTNTPSDVMPDVQEGVWSLLAFIKKVRALLNIYTEIDVAGDTLRVRIGRKQKVVRNIDLSLSAYEVLEESLSAAQTARVTVLAQDTGQKFDWYLLEDGELVAQLPGGERAAGGWESIMVKFAKQAEETARICFAQNSLSHNIEFATLNEFAFGDECILRLRDGRRLKSYVSAVRKRSGDERFFYVAGELRPLIGQTLRNRFGGS